jgi:two-component system cell cycle response regulator
VASTGEAIDFCGRTPVDLIMISLSLPDESAFTLFRVLRTNLKTKYTPVFGLVVKTDVAAQQMAQQVGFTGIATKPIDVAELESKIAKAMNLDTSLRYFKNESDLLIMSLPEVCSPTVINEVTGYLKGKVADAVDSGICKAVFDLHEVKRLDMNIIKMLLTAMQTCREVALQYTLVGNATLTADCKGYEDTRNWQFFESIEEARQGVQKLAAGASA